MTSKPLSSSAATAKELARVLKTLSRTDADYWSYKRMAQRPGLHGIIRYPAMMVPRMQADVLDAVITAMPSLSRVVDPFVGSGTTLVETVRRGISFEGYDINPLAILICRAKLLNLSPKTVNTRIRAVMDRIAVDHSSALAANFFGRDKWFTKAASVEISRIQRAVSAEPNQQLRQFMWVILSETIRQTSLSRESTYKLHIRDSASALGLSRPNERFKELAIDACARYEAHWAESANAYSSSSQVSTAQLHCGDVRAAHSNSQAKAQLLLTSPPYGDNVSTIPYGQFSYLALSWIPEEDLEGKPELRASAYSTDAASLGGSRRDYVERAVSVAGVLPSFRGFFDSLCRQRRPDLEAKAASFTADFFDAVGASLERLDDGGIAVWTLGERTIGGIRVPLISICREINQFFGMSSVAEVTRNIQSKRMPHRNSVGATMATESLLVMAKFQ